ncbi:MAG: hypothetical protein ACYDAO_03815 [Thermoplasmataceae archaeon]
MSSRFCLRVNRKERAHERNKAIQAGMMGAGCVERRLSGSERGWECNSPGLLTKEYNIESKEGIKCFLIKLNCGTKVPTTIRKAMHLKVS